MDYQILPISEQENIISDIDIDDVRKSDLKAIINSQEVQDSAFGDVATQIGLVPKRTFEDSIHFNIYPLPQNEGTPVD